MSIFKRAYLSFLTFFVSVSVHANIKNPISSGNTGNVEESVTNLTEMAVGILGAVFGGVALIMFMFIGFTFLKDREKAMEQLWSWVGGVGLFAMATGIVSGIYVAVN